MKRREAIRRISMMVGGTLSTPVISGILGGCQIPSGGINYTPETLSSDQLRAVGLMSESILPRTDTPGALDVGVDRFIDSLLTHYFSTSNRRDFLTGLDQFIARANAKNQGSFVGAPEIDQKNFIQRADAVAFPEDGDVEHSADESITTEEISFYRQFKQLVLAGYYTSEAGATEELHIAPYTTYQGDISLESVGKSWA